MKMRLRVKKPGIMLTLVSLLFSFGRMQALEENRTPENRVIYEVFVRNFSSAGNFKGVEAQVPRLKELGVDVIWLMPIYKTGDIGKWGTYSSPYAIKDYKSIEPSFGTASDLHDLIDAIHEAGMEVWFDWVGNHTSMDAVWVTQHPEFYKKNNGKFVNPNGWNDVYQLDVNNHEMHLAMIEAMQYWVDEFGIDGYRCDYASGPSQEFWREATSQVLKNGRKISWLAEDEDEPELVTNGWFDYNWTWGYFGTMYNVKTGKKNINDLRNASSALHNDSRYKGRSRILYTSSHDVVQDNGEGNDVGYRVFGNFQKPFTVLQFTVYGCPVIYNGQEINYQGGRAMLSEKTSINWNNPDAEMTALYKSLIGLKHSHPSLMTGNMSASYKNLTTSRQNNIMAYQRGEGDNALIVMLNLSSSAVNGFTVSGVPSGIFTELFSGDKVEISTSSFSLAPYGYAVYYKEEAQPQKISHFYIDDRTGWNNFYIYAWANDADAIFGKWPGVKAVDKKEIGGVNWFDIPFPTSEESVNLIFNNNSGVQYDIMDIALDKDYYFKAFSNSFSFEEDPMGSNAITDTFEEKLEDCEPVFFNLQGREVKTPKKGIYVVKSGAGVKKVLLR